MWCWPMYKYTHLHACYKSYRFGCLNERLFSYSLMSTTMHVKYMYVKYVMYSLLGWHDRCTSMGKGMVPCLYIAHVYLDRTVPRFGFYVYEGCIYEHAMNMMYMKWWSMNVHSVLVGLYERIDHIVIPIDLCIDVWTCVTIMCYVKDLITYKYTDTWMMI